MLLVAGTLNSSNENRHFFAENGHVGKKRINICQYVDYAWCIEPIGSSCSFLGLYRTLCPFCVCPSIFRMVITQRFFALHQYIWAGHQVNVTYTVTAATGKMKAKVHVSAIPNVVPEHLRQLFMATVAPLSYLIDSCITVDRGHKYSGGQAVANFWMQPIVPAPVQGSVSTELTHIDHPQIELEQAHQDEQADVQLRGDLHSDMLVMQYPVTEWVEPPILHYAELDGLSLSEVPPTRASNLRADTVMVIEHVSKVAERNYCFDNETRMQLMDRGKSLFDKMERLVSSSTTDQTIDPAELEEFLDQREALLNDLLQYLRRH